MNSIRTRLFLKTLPETKNNVKTTVHRTYRKYHFPIVLSVKRLKYLSQATICVKYPCKMNHTYYRALVYVSVWTAICSLLSYFVTHISANWITNNKRKQSSKDKWNMIPIGFRMLSFTKMLKFVYTHPASCSMVILCSILHSKADSLFTWNIHIKNHFIFYTFQKTQTHTHAHTHTGCPRMNGQNFGKMFLMLKYTDITQNTYIQSWTVMEIMAREVWKYDSCYTLTDYEIHIKTGRNMWLL